MHMRQAKKEETNQQPTNIAHMSNSHTSTTVQVQRGKLLSFVDWKPTKSNGRGNMNTLHEKYLTDKSVYCVRVCVRERQRESVRI